MIWTKQDQSRLRTLHTAQMTVKEIAKEMDKPVPLIRSELEAMGYKPIEKREKAESEFLKGFTPVEIKRTYKKVTPEIEQLCCDLRRENKSLSQITERTGISRSTAERILAKHGIKIGRNNTPKQEDKPMKPQINKEFDDAVNQMISEAKEKEPAPAPTDTDSEVRQFPNISTSNDTTKEPESQALSLSGITALTLLANAVADWIGSEGEITRMFAEADVAELFFTFGGVRYGFTFGRREVPEYGNDKY